MSILSCQRAQRAVVGDSLASAAASLYLLSEAVISSPVEVQACASLVRGSENRPKGSAIMLEEWMQEDTERHPGRAVDLKPPRLESTFSKTIHLLHSQNHSTRHSSKTLHRCNCSGVTMDAVNFRLRDILAYPLFALLHLLFTITSLAVRIGESLTSSRTIARAAKAPRHIALVLSDRSHPKYNGAKRRSRDAGPVERRAVVESIRRAVEWADYEGVQELSVWDDHGMFVNTVNRLLANANEKD